MNAPESERRLTPTERAHELLKLAMERPAPVSGLPWFESNRTKAGADQSKTGQFVFWEFKAHVPVCDEFPTSDDAYAAMVRYSLAFEDEVVAAAMRAEYGTTNGGET